MRTRARMLFLLLPFLPSLSVGQPRISLPTLREVLAGDMVGRARIRWSRVQGGGRVEVTVGAGMAMRRNPQWSEEPVRLRYDLSQHLALEQQIKRARLPAPSPPSERPEDRTLEILAQGPSGWQVVGSWSMPASRWQKQHGALYQLLEALLDAPVEVFVPLSPPKAPASVGRARGGGGRPVGVGAALLAALPEQAGLPAGPVGRAAAGPPGRRRCEAGHPGRTPRAGASPGACRGKPAVPPR
ncbi:MAG: hypothetical protein RMK29_07125 [Myxococcales bacterium]|nr:hypothetical protein [Myxococcota bacterium]MDW8281466.1 hypothetical protein [Myxococcales bacterium]